MNKSVKRIVSLLCVTALMLVSGITCLAETPELNATVNLYTYADDSQDVLDITVYPGDAEEWVTVTIADSNGLPLKYIQQKAALSNNITFSLDGVSSAEDITVRIATTPSGLTKDFVQRYYTYAEQQQAMRDIMNPAVEITQEIADKISLKLDGDFALLNSEGVSFLKQTLTDLFGEQAYIVVTDFVTALTDNIRLSVLNSKDATIIKNYIDREKVVLGLSTLTEYEWYTAYTDTEKISKITSRLAIKTYTDVPTFVNEFKAQNFLEKMSVKHSSELIGYIRINGANQSPLTLNWALYDSLEDFQQEYFSTLIVGTRFDDLSALEGAFTSKLTEAAAYVEQSGEVGTNPGDTQQGSLGTITGGSIGGGISGGTVVPPSTTPGSASGAFKDLSNVSWAVEAIDALYKKGVINGVDGQNFDPEGIVTKEQFVKIIAGTFDIKATGEVKAFSDVPSGQWYTEFINAAVENGIVNGVSETDFGLGTNISRQDMAVIVYRVATKYGITLPAVRNDNPADIDGVADYAKEAVSALYKAGIINGVGEGKFAPADIATRAQAAKIIYELWRMM